MQKISWFVSLSIASAAIMTLAACTNKPLDQAPLGSVSATGTLIPTEVSLLRRGTHILMVKSKKLYYVESKTISLVDYEGQTVFIDGIAEQNTSLDELPVLIVKTLTSLLDDDTLHVWEIPALDLKISTPDTWKGSIQKNVVLFLLPEEKTPVMTIRLSLETVLPAEGIPFYLGTHRAVRSTLVAGSGAESVFIQNKKEIIVFHFDASSQKTVVRLEHAKLIQTQFEKAIQSISFISDGESQSMVSGSGSGMPCGGVAGILCTSDSFCNIYDFENKIGKCRQITKPSL